MRYDVIVAGAGPSGFMAALAAARMGATLGHIPDPLGVTSTVMRKNGTASCRGRVFVDATGDGDLAALCHASFDAGRPSDGHT